MKLPSFECHQAGHEKTVVNERCRYGVCDESELHEMACDAWGKPNSHTGTNLIVVAEIVAGTESTEITACVNIATFPVGVTGLVTLSDANAAIKEAYEQGKRDAVLEGWQPIETAPKDGTLFIGWVSAERWSAADGGGSGIAHDVSQLDFCWWRAGNESPECGFFDSGCGQIGDAQDVTHWMPLPAAPKQEK